MDDDNHKQPPIQWPNQHNGQTQATNLARHKVDTLFDEISDANKPQTSSTKPMNPAEVLATTSKPIKQSVPAAQSRTVRPHSPSQPNTTSSKQAPTFYEYHTAWQSYYQNYFQQYYDRAYKQAQAQQQAESPQDENTGESETNQTISDLKQKLRDTVNKQTKRVSSNRHFKPALASLSVGAIFLLVNYNQVVFGAARQYITPSSTANTPIIMTPGDKTIVSNDPVITIPKIGIEAPVVYTENSFDEAKVDKALEKGVVHYGTTPLPGQNGNAVLLGHSSNNVFSPGDYKYVFVNLDKLNINDTIFLNYKGTRYTYKVTVARKVVKPSDTSILTAGKKPIITLITCTPVGTNINRLIVQAEQISPSASKNKSATPETQSEPTNLPATSKSLWGSLFQ